MRSGQLTETAEPTELQPPKLIELKGLEGCNSAYDGALYRFYVMVMFPKIS